MARRNVDHENESQKRGLSILQLRFSSSPTSRGYMSTNSNTCVSYSTALLRLHSIAQINLPCKLFPAPRDALHNLSRLCDVPSKSPDPRPMSAALAFACRSQGSKLIPGVLVGSQLFSENLTMLCAVSTRASRSTSPKRCRIPHPAKTRWKCRALNGFRRKKWSMESRSGRAAARPGALTEYGRSSYPDLEIA
ncbi:hypothetical protein EV356DRAFT_292897 [Viridothelium virens]|uniref:Uncharacterized protein n=1 Tax=Viridothelium virens TaxID=1048519 RepID=A0A6A6H005_VIRVR|nr:hypothetical protein EV356DRAFT_292897 [Viridothelium virens]